MTKIATDIKQSQKLIELGIKVNTADMWWLCFDGTITLVAKYEYFDQDPAPEEKTSVIPAWSLSALLEMMPEKTGITKDYADFYFCYNNNESHCTNHYPQSLDAAFEMVVWLKERNLV